MNGTISLAPITEKNSFQVMAFIAPREQYCVTLSEQLLKAGTAAASAAYSRFRMIYTREDNAVLGVFMISPPGLLLHCIPLPSGDEREEYRQRLAKLIRPVLTDSVIQCIMGEAEGTAFFRDMLEAKPLHVIDHYLFGFDRKNIKPTVIHAETTDSIRPDLVRPELLLRHANTADAEALFPLQKAYEKEEVLPDESMFSAAQCMAGLRQTLLTRTVPVYWNSITPVAKAAVNAEGMAWVQIGGVYTAPQWRNKGLARRLVQHIAELSAARGKGACLFVNKRNTAARNSYRNAGFTPFGEYRIVYY